MAPSVNKAASEDRSAVGKLVVRLIPRPTPRNVSVGDVVAFSSPLHPATDERECGAGLRGRACGRRGGHAGCMGGRHHRVGVGDCEVRPAGG